MLNTSQLIENISLKGYQIVDTKMFHRMANLMNSYSA